jgi:hypothetical protein
MSIAIIILIILSKILEMIELQIIQHLMIFGTQKRSLKQKKLKVKVVFVYFLSFSLISVLRIFPLIVLGSSSTNSTIRGYL